MENKLKYSFDDEPVTKFCYHLDSNKIEIHFERYYDLTLDRYIENPCVWILENWESAKSRVGDEQKLYNLNEYLSVFTLILYMRYNDEELEMLVTTLDNKYLTLFFKNPKLSLR